MKQFPELKPNLWDGLVLLLVLALALGAGAVIWGGSADAGDLEAVISVDGTEQETVPLSRLSGQEERTVEANGYTLLVTLDADGAQVRESDCPTQDCVHTGKITRPGQSIVCLPARVTVQLRGTQAPDGVDAVLG